MDRTSQFASAVRMAVAEIADAWTGDEVDFEIVDNLTSRVKLTWPPASSNTVTYEVKVTRHGPELQAKDLQIETAFSGLTGSAWVRITHIPTGKHAESRATSELNAKSAALQDLRMLVFGG